MEGKHFRQRRLQVWTGKLEEKNVRKDRGHGWQEPITCSVLSQLEKRLFASLTLEPCPGRPWC